MRTATMLTFALLVSALSAVPLAHQSSKPTQNGSAAKAASAPININTATAAELETLPGVGPATAARILEYRQKNGPFKKIEDLMNVRGIGEKTFLTLKPMIAVGPPKDVM
jgi:competence protein ComEA